jgi:hypothetical protein
MDNALSLGWTQADAQSKRATYQRILRINLVLHIVIAIVAIFAPRIVSRVLGLPAPSPAAWVQAWGLLLLLVTLLYWPGLLNPMRLRWPNIVGIVGRAGAALIYVLAAFSFPQFLVMALFDGVFAGLLAWSYFGLFRAELMSRP